MPTLGEACQQLRIGRVTLAKWIERLQIETTRHAWDWRYQVIAPEDVERIAEARRQVPARTHVPTVANMPPALSRGDSDGSGRLADTFHIPAPARRPVRRVSASSAAAVLPDGWMSRTEAADVHGLARTTVRTWIAKQGFETGGDTFGGVSGQFGGEAPLTSKGLAQLVAYARVHQPHNFHPCTKGCPHNDDDTASGAE